MHRAARLFTWLLLTLAGAQAHPILQNPVWIAASPDRITVDLHVSIRELIVVQGLTVTADGRVDTLQAEELAPKHAGYLLDHWQIKADGTPLTGTVTEIKPPKTIGEGLEGPDRAHFVYTIEYPLAHPPAVLSFRQTMCVEFPSAPGVPWDLSYAYRYGPHGETPRKFGAMARDQTLNVKTGFGPATPGTSPGDPPASGPEIIHEPMPATLLGLWIVFLAATVIGRTFSLHAPFPYTGPVIAWAAGFLAMRFLPAGAPAWLLYLIAGAVTIFTAADNIHSAASGPRRYRLALLYTGALVFGAIAAAQVRAFPQLDRLWQLAPLPAAAIAVLIGAGIARIASQNQARTATLLMQVASLICCLDAAWLMLKLLEAI